MSDLLLGTCGWSYAEWEGILYPAKQGKLKQYSSIFPTAEIDSTFYALPHEGTVLGWVRYTPRDFVFSAKLPQTITHKKAIDPARGIDGDIKQFLESMKPLTDAGKLACVLVQLPGFLRFNLERLESFLSLLPDDQNFAVEFRHDSWLREETFKLLGERHVAYTIVDEPLLPPEVHVIRLSHESVRRRLRSGGPARAAHSGELSLKNSLGSTRNGDVTAQCLER